jgi:hypothetical protein
MFHCLPGKLVSGEMIFLAMMNSGGTVRVRGLLVKFSGPLMRIVCHVGLLALRLNDSTLHDREAVPLTRFICHNKLQLLRRT